MLSFPAMLLLLRSEALELLQVFLAFLVLAIVIGTLHSVVPLLGCGVL